MQAGIQDPADYSYQWMLKLTNPDGPICRCQKPEFLRAEMPVTSTIDFKAEEYRAKNPLNHGNGGGKKHWVYTTVLVKRELNFHIGGGQKAVLVFAS